VGPCAGNSGSSPPSPRTQSAKGREHQQPRGKVGHWSRPFKPPFKIQDTHRKRMPWPWRRRSRKSIWRATRESRGDPPGYALSGVLKALPQGGGAGIPACLLPHRRRAPPGTVGDSRRSCGVAAPSRKRGSSAWWPASAIFPPPGGVYLWLAAEKIVANPGTDHAADRRDSCAETCLSMVCWSGIWQFQF